MGHLLPWGGEKKRAKKARKEKDVYLGELEKRRSKKEKGSPEIAPVSSLY